MARNPLYSSYLDFAPTFRWGGREYGQGDEMLMRKKLGKRYDRWARRHPGAARVFDPVEQQMYGAYQPELAAIDRERQRTADLYQRRLQNLGGFAAALGGLLAGGPGAMSSTYNQGKNAMLQSAGEFGNVLNADQAAQAAANNTTLGAIDAPEGQMQSGGDAGGVLAGAAGWIPATMMGEQGAAWANRMAHLPTEAALQANMIAKGLMEDARDADSEFSGKITDILSGMAGDRMKLKSQYEDQRLAKLKMDRDYAMKQAALAFSMGKYKDYQYWKRKAYQLDQQQEHRYSNKDKGLDIDGNPLPGFHLGPGGKAVKDKKPTKGKTTDWGRMQNSMADDADKFFESSSNPLTGAKTKTQWDYKKAYVTLWQSYSGYAKNSQQKARLRQIINQILRAKGFKKAYPAGVGTDHSYDVPRPR